MSQSDREQHLERLMHRTLRELPPRCAPESLQARVLAELERRSALPWWRKSFTHWPIPARAVLIVVLVGVMKFTLAGLVWGMAGFDEAQFRELFATQVAWMEAGAAVSGAITGFFEIIQRNIPAVWLYGAVAFIAAMYAALFGLGAAVYRTLYAIR